MSDFCAGMLRNAVGVVHEARNVGEGGEVPRGVGKVQDACDSDIFA